MTTKKLAQTLRVIYGDVRSSEVDAFAALMRYAHKPTADGTRQLETLGLDRVVQAVLIDGVDLVLAGKDASAGRYSTDTQARAYAVSQIHIAGRALLWNERVYAPYRKMASQLAERYRMLKAMRTVEARQKAA